jgi:hypothetical protein
MTDPRLPQAPFDEPGPLLPPLAPRRRKALLSGSLGLVSSLIATRRRRWLVIAVVICLVLAGVGWWVFSPKALQLRVIPGTVQASVLSSDEASVVLGVTLLTDTSASEPPPTLSADPPSCAVAVGPATQSVYGRGWTTFYSVTYQDSEDVADHVVIQVIGTYPDSTKAGEAFHALSEGIGKCDSASRTGADQNTSAWLYTVESSSSEALSWTAVQDSDEDWSCYRQARLKGKAVLQVAVCHAGDGGLAAGEIANQLATRVRG